MLIGFCCFNMKIAFQVLHLNTNETFRNFPILAQSPYRTRDRDMGVKVSHVHRTIKQKRKEKK